MSSIRLDSGPCRKWMASVFLGLSFTCGAQDNIGNLLDERAELESKQGFALEQQALARTKQMALLTKKKNIDAMIDQLVQDIARWTAARQNVLSNDQGKAIASDEASVAAFSVMYDKKRMSAEDASAVKNRLNNLIIPVQSAYEQQTAYMPGDEVMKQMDAEEDLVSEGLSDIRRAQDQLEALILQASGKTGPTTLDVALNNFRLKQAEQLTQQEVARQQNARAEIEKAKTERAERLAKLEADLIRQNTQQEEQLLREKVHRESQLQAAESRYSNLRARAENLTVQGQYAPFLAKGNTILDNRGRWKITSTPSPLSMTGLNQQHALTDPKRFVGVAITDKNDRPKWKKPPPKYDYGEFAGMLKEFNELAPIWVEMGLLNP